MNNYKYEARILNSSTRCVDDLDEFLQTNDFQYQPFSALKSPTSLYTWVISFTRFNATNEQMVLLQLAWGEDIRIKEVK